MVPALAKLTQSILQYYALATCTILFYDHLLTLADEAGSSLFCPRLTLAAKTAFCSRSNISGREGNRGVRSPVEWIGRLVSAANGLGSILDFHCRGTFVRSSESILSFLTEACRIGTFRSPMSFGC